METELFRRKLSKWEIPKSICTADMSKFRRGAVDKNCKFKNSLTFELPEMFEEILEKVGYAKNKF